MIKQSRLMKPTFDPVLENNTPEQIQKAARAGLAKTLWKVGDKIPITFDNKTVTGQTINGTYNAIILGFDHNADVEGANTIHFQMGIAFTDEYYESVGSSDGFRMNRTDTTNGGWESSYMRNTVCAQFLAAMPTEWQSIIIPCTKYSDNKGSGSNMAENVTATQDKIFLLSEFEVQGKRIYANSTEQKHQKQYAYYASGNSKVRYRHDKPDSSCGWWLRSVEVVNTSASFFCNVYPDGAESYASANASIGVAPGFVIG